MIPYYCPLCGRLVYTVNHMTKHVHEAEQKRLVNVLNVIGWILAGGSVVFAVWQIVEFLKG